MTKRISISATPREPITLDLIGVEYLVSPPKSTVAIALAERAQGAGNDPAALLAELKTWVKAAFGTKQATSVIKRLDDPSDDLDLPHILDLMTQLVEIGTPNPTS